MPARAPALETQATRWWVAWGRLLRLPNLFTVPGDAVAGGALAGGLGLLADPAALGRLAGAAGGVLGIYLSGLLFNDYFDRETDARERPARPLPSGAVHPTTVVTVAVVLLAGAVGLVFAVGGRPAGGFAAALGLTALAYNAGLKRTPFIGPLAMGLCRGGSVLVGAAATGFALSGMVWLAAAVLAGYIVTVTLIAAGETHTDLPPAGLLQLPGMLLLASGTAGCCWRGWEQAAGGQPLPTQALAVALLLFAIAAGEAFVTARRVTAGQLPVPAFIGWLLRILITTQAAWVVLGWGAAGFGPLLGILAGLVLLRLGAELLGRRFYGS